jgi:WD40 repeat protein/mono/diheme cytochrome c family protein
MRRGALLFTLVASVALAAEPDPREIAAQAEQVLRRYCYRCHGQDGAVEGGFNYVVDVPRLIASGKIVPGKPDQSPLWKRLAKDSMPPAGEEPRPAERERALLRSWIEAGAPPAKPIRERLRVSESEILRWVLDDLRKLDRRSRRFQRYLTLVPLYHEGLSDDELQTYRHAVAKLVNSLSWSPKVRVPEEVGPRGLLLRIDLRWYMWDANLWNRLLAEYPYGILVEGAAGRAVMTATATKMPIVRADWFVATACRPPLYFDLLQMPASLPELERQLRVDALVNIQQQRVARAGFNGSGISKNNRIIERHESVHGAYWKTYDFEAIPQNLAERGFLAPDQRNIFAFPLGPSGASLREPFLTVGGEVIFSLPNGLHGYMLYNAAGNRIDKGPIQIVSDPRRPDRAVETGISCISCHLTGINPKSDQVRDFVAKNPQVFPRAERELIEALYVPDATMSRQMREDMDRFREAIAKTGAKIGKTEPVSALTLRYEADLDLRTAAAEIGLTPEQLRDALAHSPSLSQTLGSLRVPGGTVARALWVQTFADLVKELHLGTLLSTVASTGVLPDNTGELDPLEGSGQQTNAAAISSDGRQTLLATADRTARHWDIAADREIRRFVGHAASVWSVALSPDGRRAATGSMDGTVRIWSLESGQQLKRLDGHLTLVSSIVWSADGTRVFSTGHDGEVIAWDANTGAEHGRWSRRDSILHASALSPDGKRLYVAADHAVLALSSETLQVQSKCEIGPDCPSVLAVNPKSGEVAVGTDSGQLILWHPSQNQSSPSIVVQMSSPILALAWSPSGKALAVGLVDRTVRLIDTAAKREVGRFERHLDAVVATAFVDAGQELVSVSRDSIVQRWRLTKFRDLTMAQASVTPDDSQVARPARRLLKPSSQLFTNGWIDSFQIGSTSRWLYYLDHIHRELVQIDSERLQRVRTWKLPANVESFVLTPNGRSIWLAGQALEKPALWELDAEELKVVRRCDLEVMPYDLAATDDGILFLSGREPGWSQLTVFDAKQSKVLGRWSGVWSRSWLRLRPDGRRLYVGSQGVLPARIDGFPLPIDWTTKPVPSTTPGDDRLAPQGFFTISPDGQILIARNGAVFRLGDDKTSDLACIGRVAAHLDVFFDPGSGELWLLASDGQTLKKYRLPDLKWQEDLMLGVIGYRLVGDVSRRRLFLAGVDPRNLDRPRLGGPSSLWVFDLE